MKRAVSLFVIFLFSTVIWAQNLAIPEGLDYKKVDNKNVTITKYTGNAATVNIPERIESLPVTVIGRSAFDGCKSLISITIPSSVTSIGSFAFIRCNSLTDITVDNRNSVYASIDGVLFDKNIRTIIAYPAGKKTETYAIPSSVTTIRDMAFYHCSSLINVTIPPSITVIGESAFSLCTGLTSITIPSSVTAIGDMAFASCRSLTSITIPSSVTAIGDMAFFLCSNLTSIVVDNRNSVYTSIDGVLFDKNIRTIITYPAGKKTGIYIIPSSVNVIRDQAFSWCTSLTDISIPSSVTKIGEAAFNNCSSLTSITIPSSVAIIGGFAFIYCSSLTNVTIPSSVKFIGERAFGSCNNLTSVTLSRRTWVGEAAFPETARIVYSD